MALSPLAGKPAPLSILANIPRLVSYYYTNHPDPSEKDQLVEFGTSGHRGTSLKNSFTEDHILAITQAICEFRKAKGHLGADFSRKGYPCALRAKFHHGYRGACRKRCRCIGPVGLGVYAYSRYLPRHSCP